MQISKPSDQQHKIKMDSAFIYALWSCGRAWAGSEAPFEVKTALVGEGAEIKIKLKTDSGKTLEKKTDKIYGNRYRGTIKVPDKVKMEDMLFLEVDLPKQGLSGESNQIPVGPKIQARSMKWSQKEVKRGDIVKMQTQFIDLPDKIEATVEVLEYDQDGNHNPVVSIPTEISNNQMELSWEFQYHEDTVEIPTQVELKPYNRNYQHPEYFFVVDIDGSRIGEKQESGKLRFKDWADIVMKDSKGQPLGGKKITVTLADGSTHNGNLDNNGCARIDLTVPGPYDIFVEGIKKIRRLKQTD
jgi:hypothetical protein